MFDANLGETATAVGYVHIMKHDAEGNLVEDRWFKNQLTNYARNAAAQMWCGTSLPTPNSIQVGSGSPTAPITGVQQTDTALWSPMAGTLKVVDFATVWLGYNSQYSATYQQSDALGTWTELGLFDANGNLWSHVQLNNLTKDSSSTITVQWQIQHIGN
jgi:hypothetical protein